MMTDTTIEAGRAAWARLRDDRNTWTDWLCVARCLQIGKAEAMQTAQTNRAVGSKYNTAMGNWLRDNGLDGVTAQERYRLLKILEHLTEIGTWRAGLDEGKRRTLNHPNSIWSHWRRSLKPAAPPRRQNLIPEQTIERAVAEAAHRRPIYWSQESLRRAHRAMLDSKSSDFLILARCALEGAIRCEADLLALLSTETPSTQRRAAKPPQAKAAPAAPAEVAAAHA
jgi:hypothetical protein